MPDRVKLVCSCYQTKKTRRSQRLYKVKRSKISITKRKKRLRNSQRLSVLQSICLLSSWGDNSANQIPAAMDPALQNTNWLDPHYGGPVPPWPPRRRAHTWREDKNRKIVWPKDKKQKGAHSWSRWKDMLTGKGPDMWISRRDSFGPHRPIWSGWKSPYWMPRIWDNLGYPYRRDNELEPLPWAKRPAWEKYDFRARKYQRPREGTWSDVKWNADARFPLYWQNRHGKQVVDPDFDDGWFNLGLAPNPFEWKSHSPIWAWYRDKLEWPIDHAFWFDYW